MNTEDFLSKFRKRIEFNYNKQTFFFDVNQSLFSSAKLDKGTFQLIDSLRKNDNIDYTKILDLGCGYGPIGIFLKKTHPESLIYCVERDSLAIDFAKHNAKLNGCDIKIYPGLDYQNIKEKFSLICCNYPAKAGLNAFKKFVYGASKHLNCEGIFVIVIVEELLEDFNSILREEIEVLHQQKSSGHRVFHLKFNKEIEFGEEIYSKGNIDYKIGEKSYRLKTALNVPEFDSPSFTTEAMVKILPEISKGLKISLLNPFQGHLGIAAYHYAKPSELNLVSRDLLSLIYSEANLSLNGFKNARISHKICVEEERGDLLIWRLEKDLELDQVEKQLENYRNNFNKIILGADKSKLKKIISYLKLRPLIEKEEEKGLAILIETTPQ
jgi:16S rRNA (guanine1207-N2)-methyltransferase